ncbi:MAG TPA: GNAT family N-acetyltransferase [Chitinophagaceae bacterium]|nr:GNAT family N-acetyltransferase [Chitinophagaceae bacterium]
MPLEKKYELVEITDGNIGALFSLAGEATRNGYYFLQRTIDDWRSGANRFNKPGEMLWGLFAEKELIGIGGLNIDPYSRTQGVGRVRHLYIKERYRRAGYATLLIKKIMEQAAQHFIVLRLFTDSVGASAFYEKLGFTPTGEYKASHFIKLPGKGR